MRAGTTLVFLAAVLVAQTSQPDPPGAIRGTVKDTAGLPVSGITVEALRGAEPVTVLVAGGGFVRISGGRPATTVTDEDGKYAIKDLTSGTYSVRTERDPESGSYRQIKVDAGQESTLDLVVPTNVVISGRVLDRNGDPVISADVWLLKTEYQGGILKQLVSGPKVTKEDGSYLFDFGLEANRRYYILVDREVSKELLAGKTPGLKDRERIEVPTYYPSATRVDLASPLILQPGERREKIDIKVATALYYCVDGKIPDSEYFSIQDSQLAGTSLARTRDKPVDGGKFRVCGLPSGQYKLSTDHDSTEFTVASSDLQHVDLSADPARLRLEVDWADSAAPKIDPVNDANLRKFGTALGLDDAANLADLKDLVSRLVQGESATEDDINSLAARLGKSRDFTAGRLAAVTAFLATPFLLNITLHGAASPRPIPFAVRVPYDSPTSRSIPPGDYAVEFQTFGKTVTCPKEISFNGVQPIDGILRFVPASSNTLRISMALDVATVSVSVVDSEGKPVPNATVMLIPDSLTSPSMLSRISTRGLTDQNGNYNSPPLAPGRYRVLATTQTVRWNAPDDLERVLLALSQAKNIEVAPKATVQVAAEPIAIY